MKNNTIFYLLLLLVVSQSACKKDFLNKQPLDAYSNSSLWSSQSDALAALNGCYSGWENAYNILYTDAVSDNLYSQYYWEGYTDYGNGSVSASNTNVYSRWNYVTIQKCNWFLENIDATPMDAAIKARYKSEVRFLRAYEYFVMSQLYGDVPLVKSSISASDANNVERTPFATVRKFVTNELDTISSLLPKSYSGSEIGRITQGAAIALKARMELYDKNYTDCITDCQKVMALGYQLFPSYQDLFRIQNENNSEVILDVQYKENDYGNYDLGVMPSASFGGWGSLDPTQSLVDAYEMKNGKLIGDNSSGYDVNDPYNNRDQRLTATVVCPGQPYEGSFYNSIESSSTDFYNSDNNSKTGYIPKKFTADLSDYADMWNTGLNMIVIRYAEILLSYAEAKIETNSIDNTVYDAINLVRLRAGMPAVNQAVYNDQNSLRTLVRRERRVELALEGLRWYDIQRWKIGPETRAGEVYGVRIGTVDPVTGKLQLTGDHVKVEKRTFDPARDYLWPVPQTEININKKLMQNPNY